MAFVSRNLRAVTVHSMRRNAKSCSGNNKSGKIGVFRRHLASYPVGSKDERHSEAFLDIENTKPYVKNHEIHVTERCEELFKDILKLDTVEMHLLTQLVKVRFGLSPNDATDVGFGRNRAATGGDTDKEEMANEERTIFDLKLTGFDDKSKIKVIKEVRSISGLGLKDAKELVEGVPKVVKKDVKKDEADELKLKLEAVGATVEIV